MKSLFLFAALFAAISTGVAQRIFCYYNNWSRYGNEPFMVENIDPTLCTHIVYFAMGLNQDGYVGSDDPWNDYGDAWTEGGLIRFLKLKKSNPSVKLLMGVGGWNQGPTNFQAVVKDPKKRKNFLESSISLISKYNFDGLEIVWMYHNQEGGTPEDKAGYSALVKELKTAYKQKNYVLGIATSARLKVVDNSLDIRTLTQHVDYINVLTYDLHGSWELRTGHTAPLHPKRSETPEEKLNSVEAVIEQYILRGAKPSDLIVSVVGYGRTFTLMDPNNSGMGAPARGPGREDPLPYRKFCVQDNNNQWKKFWEEEQKVPYAVFHDMIQWVGNEDIRSLTEKVKFIKSKKLGGISFSSFDMDDFKGNCGRGKFPLLRTVKEQMSKN